MKGNPAIIDLLNAVLTGELTAINQYFIHAKMCKNWGYNRLAAKIKHESIDEMKHADALIERVLYLEGIPNLQRLGKVNVGETVPEQFKVDLALEYEALQRLNDGIKLCRDSGDHGSEELLRHILVSEEEHTDWLETQMGLVAALGEAGYLAQQLEG
ncbi:MAG: bacterioferritin [Myxococcales bacterium]|jgi:bacterioferritin|nr:bacterioferritin [Myxococcales bacterium]